MAEITLADVSEWQGSINWAAYPSPAAVVRLNYGAFYPDRMAGVNIAGARARCKVRGWYTYLVAGQAPEPQADALANVLAAHGGLLAGEFIACDDEEGSGDQAPRVHAYFDRLHSRFHESAGQDWVYAGLYFARTHLGSLKGYHRWLAAYGAGEMGDQHDLWQFTSSGQMAGIQGNVDVSIFHGTIEQLAALIGGKPPEEPDMHRVVKGDQKPACWKVEGNTKQWIRIAPELNHLISTSATKTLEVWPQYVIDRYPRIPEVPEDLSGTGLSSYEAVAFPFRPEAAKLTAGAAEAELPAPAQVDKFPY